jgi:hypothetical protein
VHRRQSQIPIDRASTHRESHIADGEAAVVFAVEPTEYGWSVSEGPTRLGLFMTREQALIEVEKRRVALKAKGHPSSVVVNGFEEPTNQIRSTRWPPRARR